MNQKLCHVQLPLKLQSCQGDVPGRWDRVRSVSISAWLMSNLQLVMGCKKLLSLNSMGHLLLWRVLVARPNQILRYPVWQLFQLAVVITSLKKIIHFWSWWGSSSVWHPGYSPHSQPLIEQVLDFLFASLKKCSRTVDGEFKCFTAFLGDVACCFMAQMISQQGFS